MKYTIAIAAFVISVALVPAIARADCGNHQLQTEAPKMLAVEALPQTYENVNWNGARRTANVESQTCPDDSQARQFGTDTVWRLWGRAILLQDDVALVNLVAQGQVEGESAACAPLYRDEVREAIFVSWNAVGLNNFNPAYARYEAPVQKAKLKALRATPYYATHVLPMWRALAVQMSMSLHPIEKPATGDAADPYLNKVSSEHAHLPDGLNCDYGFGTDSVWL